MKRLLLIVVTAATMLAWGQSAPEASKRVNGTQANPQQTVIIQGSDGRMHELQVPTTSGRILESMTGSQAGCPVQIVNASFDRPAEFMLTSHSRAESSPTLRLDYRNFSGKDIESVVLTGWIKVKDSAYQLDSVSHSVELQLSRKALLGRDVEATQALKLAPNAIGFDRVELAQVTYVDGTSWSPKPRSCVYANAGVTERAKAW